eukprot:CAMPEP_0198282804 /NCGR_PEP_ID=MMETSP1449-20131203/2561_1 /TAXON_ID=420275 /ORGANISM="Attheya septentrionalis, Strain CCMP2084" /LENGTH=30 /DNA_ID= /DNA_START= /DNA_END= /DNA_ORIENTATION=
MKFPIAVVSLLAVIQSASAFAPAAFTARQS